MQSRRSLRLAAGALVLAAPLLGSCGFDKATDLVYTPAATTNDRDGDVDVLSAGIVSAQPGSGTFIASLSNNRTDQAFQLQSVKGAGKWTDLKLDPDTLEIDVPATGFVNLVDEDPITVTGDLTPGQLAELTLSFDSGDAVTMMVPVLYACNEFEGLDGSGSGATGSASGSPSASISESPSESESPSAGDGPTEGASESESPTANVSPSATGSEDAEESVSAAPGEPYNCGAVGED